MHGRRSILATTVDGSKTAPCRDAFCGVEEVVKWDLQGDVEVSEDDIAKMFVSQIPSSWYTMQMADGAQSDRNKKDLHSTADAAADRKSVV